ncbi:MAG: glutamate--tRNA ligase [Alphaproteobacteria bacterium CG11_big_fil_rev_8_21_14_0_20_39_49]|nr:MAG: glutamate--tRNA ligase [Alphaproteobacteria bacterium CG11_big_fil_rev_8_21_14_0_20_39_49]
MTVITRFAPSPTGLIHIGNVRTALLCYLIARQNNGKFMLRLDDTDTERSKEEYATAIKSELKWLGLDWDIFARQSDRLARYEEIKQKLISDDLLYPCYESAEELEVKRKMLINRGLPPIYDRAALRLTEQQKADFEKQGIQPHWRFKLDDTKTISWEDEIKGTITFEAKNLSDPVLIRANGNPTYMLPSAIDDVDFDITHVVRGEDHVSNTAIQIQLFEAIGGKIPTFAHSALMKAKDGKISKREGGYDIAAMREEGIEVLTINSFLARLGTSDPVEPRTSMQEIIDNFDIKRFTKNAAIYEYIELERLNPKIIHKFSFNDVKDRAEMKGIDEEFFESVKANLNKLSEIQQWWEICKKQLTPIIDDADFAKTASELLPDGKWDENTWSEWTSKVKEATGRKGKDLFMPIRKALTARDNGPELKLILPLIGNEKATARLNGKAA